MLIIKLTAKAKTMCEFGKFLKEQRELKGLSAREFAKVVGVSASYICQIEGGKATSFPSEKVLVKISDIFRMDKDILLAMTGKVSSDVLDIIKSDPVRFAGMIRSKVMTKAG